AVGRDHSHQGAGRRAPARLPASGAAELGGAPSGDGGLGASVLAGLASARMSQGVLGFTRGAGYCQWACSLADLRARPCGFVDSDRALAYISPPTVPRWRNW